ncbi:hypothetical protein [Pseudoxanthomonas sacheonensis]|uniref:Uncharacterized protein n=1 Tax=Pseudoxanthomonas sacheonensis TaxID=443615 RepID=A0ABU1RR05_9GAMM|nr:hypothetical protein [Pseudoxanthomonas sacheonensis]MDR6841208.1 hypothetical protein [Pseudoxanthomonas sacheonensis]
MFTHRLGVGDSYEITASLQLNGAGSLELVYVGPMKPERISALGDVLAQEFLDLVRTVRILVTKGFENEKESLLKKYRGRALDQVVKGVPMLQRNIWPKRTDPAFIKYRDRKMAGLSKP